ncbi:MAG TPA: DUF2726 domain-containing protein [Lysobacter sp.]|nr:DUF2726 domain-containing protein [Lysobacter sp.]
MEALLPWILASVVLAVLVTVLLAWRLPRRRSQQPKPLPTEWALAPRPVFSTDERRVYRQLREALPHHIVLSKLPLVRFCQPSDPNEVRYWYELLGSIHVTFAICSANGRVLAAIDLDTDRGNSRRVTQIKQSVLGACRVRYLRCPVDNLPSIAELQLLVPQAAAASRGPQPAPSRSQRPADAAADAGSTRRRRERATLWQDSSFFQDSFFAPDNRLDVSVPGDIGGHDPRATPRSMPPEGRDAGEPDASHDGDDREHVPGTGTHN